MSREILSLPGIDTTGQREFLGKGIQEEPRDEVDAATVMKRELGGKERVAVVMEKFIGGVGGARAEGVLGDVLEADAIRERVGELSTGCTSSPMTLSAGEPFSLPEEDAPHRNTKNLLEIERKLTELEIAVGSPPSHTPPEALPKQPLETTLKTILTRLDAASQPLPKTTSDLLTHLEKSKEHLMAKKDEYNVLSAAAVAVKISILYNVVESVASVEEYLPALADRLQCVKQMVDNKQAVLEVLRDEVKPEETSSDTPLIEEANTRLRTLTTQLPATLPPALSTLAPTASTMSQLAARMTAAGLTG